MLKKDEFIVVSDEEAGAVWMPECGGLKATTPEHARAIEANMDKYFRHELSLQDEIVLEEYLRKSFQGIPKLSLEETKNLLERKSLSRLEIMVANDCNLACKYCYANAGTYGKRPQRMNSETAVEYLHKLLDGRYENVDRVTFFGGEPTLCPDTIQAVCEYFRQAVSYGQLKSLPNYGMVTNGTLIDERMAKIIHDFNIIVTVSADGPEQINDLLRVDKTGAGTFQKMKEGIRQIKCAGGEVRLIEATYTAKHQELGYSRAAVKEFLQQHFNIKNVLVADCEATEWNTGLACSDSSEEFYNNSRDKRKILAQLQHKCFSDIACGNGFTSMALMPNGEIYPCHFFTEYPEYRIAEYRENAFDFSGYPDVLNKLQNAYHTKNESCRECGARFTCPTCAANMIIKKNSICKIIRENQKSIVLECVKTHFK